MWVSVVKLLHYIPNRYTEICCPNLLKCRDIIRVLLKILYLGKTIGIVDKDVTVIDLDKRPDKEKIIRELEQLTGNLYLGENQVRKLFYG